MVLVFCTCSVPVDFDFSLDLCNHRHLLRVGDIEVATILQLNKNKTSIITNLTQIKYYTEL